jgi:hypothetical protein
MPWTAQFTDPVALPDGGKLRALQDAGAYITSFRNKRTTVRLGRAQCTSSSRPPIMAGRSSSRASV